jgi:membrane AbrB-like protein
MSEGGLRPPGDRRLRVALACALGLAGAAAGVMLGLPAPALLGSTLLASAAALAGAPLEVPNGLRNFAFAVIGCSLGSGVTPQFLEDVARWPVSLAVLSVTVLAVMAASSTVLVRGFGYARTDALLATAPGALSYALALAVSRGRDLRPIMVLQTLRLLAVTVTLPPLLGLLGSDAAPGGGDGRGTMPYLTALATVAAAAVAGTLAARRGMPAAHMLAGLLISGALHAAGMEVGRFPPGLTFVAFAMTGAVIGARFAQVSLRDIRELAVAAAASISVALALSALVAVGVAALLGMPFGQVWVAYAPGGIEAMAAMGLALGYDPAFVATHHLVRILLVIGLLPLLIRGR